MNSLINLGKYLFAIPFLIFGVNHFLYADMMAGMAPGGVVMVYITGIAMILAALSIFTGKLDKLACLLLALLLLLYIILIHAPGMGGENMASSMTAMLKDLALMGGALMAASQARDNAIVG